MCFLLTARSGRMLTEGPAELSSCILLLHGACSQPLTFLFTALYIVKIMYEVCQPKPLHCSALHPAEVCVCGAYVCACVGHVQKLLDLNVQEQHVGKMIKKTFKTCH